MGVKNLIIAQKETFFYSCLKIYIYIYIYIYMYVDRFRSSLITTYIDDKRLRKKGIGNLS